jgi:hypothetical protein
MSGVTPIVHGMHGRSPDWPFERRELPAHLLDEAAANPGGSVAEIDGSMVGDPDGYVPVEAIIGAWVIGPDGRPTGDYLRNPAHGPVRDDFTRLTEPDHWLGWLSDDPALALRESIAGILDEQVSGAVVEWLKVVDEPVFLTGGRRNAEDPERLVVTRAAMAAPFALSVRDPDGSRHVLAGVHSWAAVRLDTPAERRDRVWFDLGLTRDEAAELLQHRIYEVDG